MDLVTAIIPAYNESNRIADTINQIKKFVDEIIVIDDASTDNTAYIANKSGATVLTHSVNKGYIEAIKYGFKMAHGNIVITLDADGEFPANRIPDILRPILENQADMVQGHRDLVPRPSERLITWLARKKTDVGDSGTGMRALKTELAKKLILKGKCICGVFSLEVASMGGRIMEIPITLVGVDKPRKIAWFHCLQLFYLLPWLFKKFPK